MAWVTPAAPVFPLISHFDGRLLETGGEAWDDGLASIALPVDWLAVVARLEALGAPLGPPGSQGGEPAAPAPAGLIPLRMCR